MTPPSDSDHADAALARQVALAVTQLPDAPAAWVQAAIGLWPAAGAARAAAEPPSSTPSPWAGLRRLLAELRFDSAAQPALALGMRGGAGASRQLLYSAEGHDLDLRITPAPDGRHWQLDGQVLGPAAQARVLLACGDAAAAPRQCGLDELGEFHFHDLGPGQWLLQLAWSEHLVQLPPIALGPSAAPGSPP